MVDLGVYREVRQEAARKKAAAASGFGANLPSAVADVAMPFPDLAALRAVSPVTDQHSYLIPYFYRAASRWVLYDAVPRILIQDDELQGCPITGAELLAALTGPRPSELQDWERCPYVSDVQHEMYRRYKVYARPYWVLQGDAGGHQVRFSPWQQNVLMAKNLPHDPPAIGSLPACPWDNRVTKALNHLNRLRQFDGRLDKLRASASTEFANQETAKLEREIRDIEMAFIESQMTPLVDMATSLGHGAGFRSEHQDQLVHCPGMASKAADAYQEYRETGVYSLRNITGTGV